MYNEIEKFLTDWRKHQAFYLYFYALLYYLRADDVGEITWKWEGDLDTVYIEDDCQEAIKVVNSTIICNRDTQYKIIHRLHITPFILNKTDHQFSPLCNKFGREVGTFNHSFWKCKLNKRFCSDSTELSGMFGVKVSRASGQFLFVFNQPQ